MKLTRNMMEMLRQRYALAADDSSMDVEILKMSPVDIVRDCTAWTIGDPSWANEIAAWMVHAGAKPQDF